MRAFEPLLVLAVVGFFQVTSTSDADCKNQVNCGKCISVAKCAWCPTTPKLDEKYQCQIANQSDWCPETVFNPKNYKQNLLNVNLSIDIPRVQIKPQKIRIKTRPGVKNVFYVDYVQAIDYPLDLYYLMDLSQSMLDDKKKLSDLGNDLAESMRAKSNNLRMGFGSFVDKRTMPFVNTFAKDNKPCENCAPAYSFKNHLVLTEKTEMFAKSVDETQISGNIDYPEGGFDALMQVMVCKDDIQWRNDSLHMIIFSTDAESHYAGDGKLGGIVEPNDEQCHLDATGDYTYDLLQDYPSIGQIRNIASRERMNIIFAVSNLVKPTYERLGKSISGTTDQTGVLAEDSKNIVDLVKGAYDELTQSVTMKVENARDVSIQFKSKCLNSNEEMKVTDNCKIKSKGDKVTFEVTLEVTKCPANRSQWKQNIMISPTPAVNTHLEIELEIDCECDCEKPGNFDPNSQKCSKHGDLKCGTCICNDNYWGKDCNCDAKTGSNSNDEDLTSCRQNPDDEVCSGLGVCKCKQCQCIDKKLSGLFCECNTDRCPKNANKEICSGHGSCESCSGICNCNLGWTEKSCDCTTNTEQCTLTGEVCSGHGTCKCGVCKCDPIKGGGRYTGTYCEDCPTCGGGHCDVLQPCVEFDVYHTEGVERPAHCNYTLYKILDLTNEAIAEAFKGPERLRREIQPEVNLQGTDEGLPSAEASAASKLCSYPDKQGCTYYFKYFHSTDKLLHVFAKQTKECGEPVNIIGVVAGLIGAIVLAGIVMLVIWKIATSIHDRREFAKFENERQAAMFDAGHNPLYREPASTFQNPTFNGH